MSLYTVIVRLQTCTNMVLHSFYLIVHYQLQDSNQILIGAALGRQGRNSSTFFRVVLPATPCRSLPCARQRSTSTTRRSWQQLTRFDSKGWEHTKKRWTSTIWKATWPGFFQELRSVRDGAAWVLLHNAFGSTVFYMAGFVTFKPKPGFVLVVVLVGSTII